MITQSEIIGIFDYSVEHGGLYYKHDRKYKKAGDRAGSKHSRGYRHVAVAGVNYKEHILVWIYFYGAMPNGMQIDHRDNVRDNNRIENLRLGTGNNNQHNRGKNKNNTTGFKGVSVYRNKFCAEIMSDNIKRKLGFFNTKEEAAIAYNNAAIKFHGEFANLNQI